MRSDTGLPKAFEYIRGGKIGAIQWARGLCYKRRGSIGLVEGPQEPPATCDYDLWTGPAPLVPLRRKSLHYDWHWVFDTGNGDLGNQGVHQVDIARWGLGLDAHPSRITSCGGRVGYVDDGNTPNTQVTLLDYGDKSVVFEVRGLETGDYKGARIGVRINRNRLNTHGAGSADHAAGDFAPVCYQDFSEHRLNRLHPKDAKSRLVNWGL